MVYNAFWLHRGCALCHDGLKASALDVVHPKGKGKGKGKVYNAKGLKTEAKNTCWNG